MPAAFRSAICAAIACFCGCLLGTPQDHDRPHGHQDTKTEVSPTDGAILFNAAGTGGRDLYLLDSTGSKVSRIAETPECETSLF